MAALVSDVIKGAISDLLDVGLEAAQCALGAQHTIDQEGEDGEGNPDRAESDGQRSGGFKRRRDDGGSNYRSSNRSEGGYKGGNYKGRSSEGGYKGGSSEGGYKPRSEGGYKPRAEGGYKPREEGGYKPKTEGGYKPREEGGYKPRTEGAYGATKRDGGAKPSYPGKDKGYTGNKNKDGFKKKKY